MMNLSRLLGLRRSRTPFEEKDVALIIADIGGYTEFMLSTQTSLLHGQFIINELIQAIIEQVRIPLKVAKLEGDAVFLYAVKEHSDARWQAVRRQIGEKLLAFFDAFSDKLRQLGEATHCTCDACVNIGGLRLKAIIHTEAAFRDIPIPGKGEWQQHQDTYPAIGTLRTHLYPVYHHLSHGKQ